MCITYLYNLGCFVFIFLDKVSCSPGWIWIHYVAKGSLITFLFIYFVYNYVCEHMSSTKAICAINY